MKHKDGSAYRLGVMTAAMLIFGSIGLFRVMIPISSSLTAFFRGVIGSGALLALTAVKKVRPFEGLTKKTEVLLAVSGALIGINWLLLFEAYDRTSVQTATLCYYMEPGFVILLSAAFFGERLTPVRVICLAAALAGMFLVSGIADGGLPTGKDLSGMLFGLGASLLYSAVVLLNKYIPVHDPFGGTIIQLASASAVLLPYILISGGFSELSGLSDLRTILLLIVIGVVHTGLAYAMYFGSMSGLPVQTVAVFSYIDPVAALLLSGLFLHERLTPAGLAGAVLIIGSAVFCAVSDNRPVPDIHNDTK